jgi:hypothetical protein
MFPALLPHCDVRLYSQCFVYGRRSRRPFQERRARLLSTWMFELNWWKGQAILYCFNFDLFFVEPSLSMSIPSCTKATSKTKSISSGENWVLAKTTACLRHIFKPYYLKTGQDTQYRPVQGSGDQCKYWDAVKSHLPSRSRSEAWRIYPVPVFDLADRNLMSGGII